MLGRWSLLAGLEGVELLDDVLLHGDFAVRGHFEDTTLDQLLGELDGVLELALELGDLGFLLEELRGVVVPGEAGLPELLSQRQVLLHQPLLDLDLGLASSSLGTDLESIQAGALADYRKKKEVSGSTGAGTRTYWGQTCWL